MKIFALLTLLIASLHAQEPKQEPKQTTPPPSPAPATAPDFKPCSPGENSPAGTIADGYRKVIEVTPFGNACRWVKNN